MLRMKKGICAKIQWLDITLKVQMEFPIKFDKVKSRWSTVYIEGSQVLKKFCISFSEN